MQQALRQLQHPMMGQWLSLIRTSLKNIYTLSEKSKYEPLCSLTTALCELEGMRWPISSLAPNPPSELRGDSAQGSSKASPPSLTPLAWFIQHRNTHHGHFATLTDHEVEQALRVVLPRLEEVVVRLSCFCNYRLVHRDPESNSITLLHGDGVSGFPRIADLDPSLFNGKGFSNEREQVALVYPGSTLAIPLTFLVTREDAEDEFEGIVRFRTATIEREPLLYDGVDNTKRRVIYLGSGTRSLRRDSYQAVKELFDATPINTIDGEIMSAPDHLRLEADAQLAALSGVKYQPQTYIIRQADTYLKRQLLLAPDAASRPALLVVGISGSGKSSLLCRLASDLLQSPENKHQVSLRLAEAVGGRSTMSLEHGLAADMGYHSGRNDITLQELFVYWAKENRRRNIHNPYLWIIWDALNEGDSLERLLIHAGEAATEISAWNAQSNGSGQVRLLLSCRREPWEELLLRVRQNAPDAWPFGHVECFRHFRDTHSQRDEPAFSLPLFADAEAQRAYENYQAWASANYAPFANIPWKLLNPGQRELLRIPLNCWLFHQTFNGKESDLTTKYTTARLWQRFLEHSVQRHAPMGHAVDMLGSAMWEAHSARASRTQIQSSAQAAYESKLSVRLGELGLTEETFSALPEAARRVLAAKIQLDPLANPIELLHAAGLVTVKEDGTIGPTYQTLAESIAGWVLWRDLLVDWNPATPGELPLEAQVAKVQRDAPEQLRTRLKPWTAKAGWPEGRTALLNQWGLRARAALEAGIPDEAMDCLAELQTARAHLAPH